MHIGYKIKELIRSKKIRVTDFAKTIGKNREYMYTIMNSEDIDTELLRKIAKALSVPMYTFFDDQLPDGTQSITGNGNGNVNVAAMNSQVTISDKDKEIEHLKELLAEKERLIQVLMKDKQ